MEMDFNDFEDDREGEESNEDEKESFMESYLELKNSTLEKSLNMMNLQQVMQISTWLKTYLRPTLHNKDFLVLLPIHSASGVYNSKRFQRQIMK
ncbi:unnamed protein product [Brassica rapa]|uniref:Uncharacterized protein n=1 Tax=Brassica campestris TaxID=3711 RepID=A0A8D9M3Y0_BRACM|nr:unnamed protein product [Brassica rapa]